MSLPSWEGEMAVVVVVVVCPSPAKGPGLGCMYIFFASSAVLNNLNNIHSFAMVMYCTLGLWGAESLWSLFYSAHYGPCRKLSCCMCLLFTSETQAFALIHDWFHPSGFSQYRNVSQSFEDHNAGMWVIEIHCSINFLQSVFYLHSDW